MPRLIAACGFNYREVFFDSPNCFLHKGFEVNPLRGHVRVDGLVDSY